MTTAPDPRFFYDTIADRFEGLDHPHDIATRLQIVFDDLLGNVVVRDGRVLDAGCGYGAFSREARKRGARVVVSCDIARNVVLRASATTSSHGVVSDACCLAFRDATFATVISSEMVEHVERPVEAVRELARVLQPGGVLVITTPNRPWQGVVRMASRLRLRPFHGLENFLWWSELEAACVTSGLEILRHIGFHSWPFQLGLPRLSRSVDRRFGAGAWARLMINQAVLARKPGGAAHPPAGARVSSPAARDVPSG